jgi:CubicO group peptidase (beta-lactamase class C family)
VHAVHPARLRTLIAVGMAVLAASSIGARQNAASSSQLEGVSAALQKHIDAGTIPGAVVLVARGGQITYWEARGLADGPTKTPLARDTVFWVASMTKPLVAASIMMMVEEGKVRVDDPVSRFIPEFKNPARVRLLKPGSVLPGRGAGPNAPQPEYDIVPAKRPITVKDLLTHTSGLQSIGVPNDAIPPMQEGETTASFVPKLASVPLDFEPGTRWAYSNATGFDVLLRVVEVASGMPMNRFLKERLFDPLGMASSGFGRRRDLESRTMPLPANFATNQCVLGTTYSCGSAGLWMPADDYFRFAQMLLNRGRANGRQLLKPETIAMMTANHAGDLFPGTGGISGKGARMGLSMLRIEDNAAAGVALPNGSFGWDGVGTRRFWVVPSLNTVIVMLLPSGNAPAVHRDIERVVVNAFTTTSAVR